MAVLNPLYPQGTTHTVNGLTAFRLLTSQGTTPGGVNALSWDYGDTIVYARLFKRTSGGTETWVGNEGSFNCTNNNAFNFDMSLPFDGANLTSGEALGLYVAITAAGSARGETKCITVANPGNYTAGSVTFHFNGGWADGEGYIENEAGVSWGNNDTRVYGFSETVSTTLDVPCATATASCDPPFLDVAVPCAMASASADAPFIGKPVEIPCASSSAGALTPAVNYGSRARVISHDVDDGMLVRLPPAVAITRQRVWVTQTINPGETSANKVTYLDTYGHKLRDFTADHAGEEFEDLTYPDGAWRRYVTFTEYSNGMTEWAGDRSISDYHQKHLYHFSLDHTKVAGENWIDPTKPIIGYNWPYFHLYYVSDGAGGTCLRMEHWSYAEMLEQAGGWVPCGISLLSFMNKNKSWELAWDHRWVRHGEWPDEPSYWAGYVYPSETWYQHQGLRFIQNQPVGGMLVGHVAPDGMYGGVAPHYTRDNDGNEDPLGPSLGGANQNEWVTSVMRHTVGTGGDYGSGFDWHTNAAYDHGIQNHFEAGYPIGPWEAHPHPSFNYTNWSQAGAIVDIRNVRLNYGSADVWACDPCKVSGMEADLVLVRSASIYSHIPADKEGYWSLHDGYLTGTIRTPTIAVPTSKAMNRLWSYFRVSPSSGSRCIIRVFDANGDYFPDNIIPNNSTGLAVPNGSTALEYLVEDYLVGIYAAGFEFTLERDSVSDPSVRIGSMEVEYSDIPPRKPPCATATAEAYPIVLQLPLTASTAGEASVSSVLGLQVPLAASGDGAASIVASMNALQGIVASSSGSTVVASLLNSLQSLMGTSGGSAGVSGSMSALASFVAAASGIASVSSDVDALMPLVATVTASGSVSASVDQLAGFIATASGESLSSSQLNQLQSLVATAVGEASVQGIVVGAGGTSLTATAEGTASGSAVLGALASAMATAEGAAVGSAVLGLLASVVANGAGSAQAVALLSQMMSLSAEADAEAIVSAVLGTTAPPGSFEGVASGSADVEVTVSSLQAVGETVASGFSSASAAIGSMLSLAAVSVGRTAVSALVYPTTRFRVRPKRATIGSYRAVSDIGRYRPLRKEP